jgi:preprotein translocase subunit SecA
LLQGGGSQPQGPSQPPEEKIMPVKSEKIANRNDKVSVQYADGKVMKDVKYKKVEDDIKNGKCIVIEG